MPATEINSFLRDLKAALLIGCDLEAGDVKSHSSASRLTSQQLDQLAGQDPQNGAWPDRLTAAFEVFGQTGTMPIVFEALSVRLKSDSWVRGCLKRACWYLLLIIVTMAAGLATVHYFTSEQHLDLRADLGLMSAASYVPQSDPAAWVPAAIVVSGILGLLLLVWMCLGGSRRLTMWLGGRKIVQLHQSATVLRILESTKPTDDSLEDTIELACNAVAAGPKVRRQLSASLRNSNSTTGLSAWADAMTTAARDRMTAIELWVPLTIVTVFGGALAVFYCLLIYRPIISVLTELASAADGI